MRTHGWARGLLRAGSVACGLALAMSGAAADWVGRPFNPPVGSRWIIQRDLTSEDNDNGTLSGHTMKITSELTIEAKLAEGFRVAYARRASSYEGDPTDAAAARAALAALQGLLYRVVTDAAGKPLRIENLDETIATQKKMADALAATGKDAQTRAAIMKLVGDMAGVDGARAAELYLDELPNLAVGQDTGLKIGEVRRSAAAEHNQFGLAAFVKNVTFSIASVDEASGEVHLTLTEVTDPDSMRTALIGMYEKLRASDPEGVEEKIRIVKSMTLSQENRTEFDVVDGMTRRTRSLLTTRRTVAGDTLVMTTRTSVSVSPAP
jgi:hypothetical protein